MRFTHLFSGIVLATALTAGSAAAQPTTNPSATSAVVVPATIDAFEQADLYPKTTGYISAINVDIGDHAAKGTVLAVIDVPELDRDFDEAVATLAAKKQAVAAAESTVVQAKRAIDVAHQQMARYKADLHLQELTLQRQEELFSGKAATQQQLDEIRSRTEVARADVGVAEAKIAAAEADAAGTEAARGVAAAQAQVAAAQVEKIRTLQGYTKIAAPFDGVITRRLVDRGAMAQSAGGGRATPLFTIQRMDIVRVFCDVPEAQSARVSQGTPAEVKVYALGGKTIAGAVTRSAMSLSSEMRTLRVEIDLPNPEQKLLPGMYAQVTLTLR